ncbi:hypothetical protein CC80DRAFT_495334 [Byssothecium circinans]|uniref:Uncharacterized protein n=1 Tax=Byssothecium circinans TaxID=147558 RepID=A0A6A5TK50_9PLEO|nr:hypothetical protein CC80DRAFT_495334 [Byssothecium circinans]
MADNPGASPPTIGKVVRKRKKVDEAEKEEKQHKHYEMIKAAVVSDTPIHIPPRTWNSSQHHHLSTMLDALELKYHRRATRIFFLENTFHFQSVYDMRKWLCSKSQSKIVRNLAVDVDPHNGISTLVTQLLRCKQLEKVTLGVDEAYMVWYGVRSDTRFQRQRQRPQDIPFSMNRVIMRIEGMNQLRALRIKEVEFVPHLYSRRNRWPESIPRTSGPIPGGVLETVVRREMMRVQQRTAGEEDEPESMGYEHEAKRTKLNIDGDSTATPVRTVALRCKEVDPNEKKASKTFLDLPPELRNTIYEFVFDISSPVNLSTNKPTAAYTSVGMVGIPEEEVPQTSLNVFRANKQIYAESCTYFLQKNTLIFYFPLQFLTFLEDMSDERKSWINKLSLWYKKADHQGENLSIWDLALTKLRKLSQLKEVEIVLSDDPEYRSTLLYKPGTKAGQILYDLSRKGCTITFRCPEADCFLWHNIDENGNLDPESTYKIGRASTMESWIGRSREMNAWIQRTQEELKAIKEDAARAKSRANEVAAIGCGAVIQHSVGTDAESKHGSQDAMWAWGEGGMCCTG